MLESQMDIFSLIHWVHSFKCNKQKWLNKQRAKETRVASKCKAAPPSSAIQWERTILFSFLCQQGAASGLKLQKKAKEVKICVALRKEC